MILGMTNSMGHRRLLILPWLLIAALAYAGVAFGNPSMARLQEMLELTSYPPDWKPPAFRTVTPDGQSVSLAGLRGKVVLINFWASWCAPCRDEHPFLVQLAKQSKAPLTGINYKDQTAAARRFLGRFGNPFVAVGVDAKGMTAIEWGVAGMPETFLVGGDGTILFKHVGPINGQIIEKQLMPAIRKARAEG